MALEVEVKLEDASVERALESVPLAHLPLLVYDSEGDVLVWDARAEPDRQRVSRAIRLEVELRCARFIGQIRVENVEFVTLNDLGRRVLGVVVRLVVLIPLVALLDTVEEARFPHDEELLLRFKHHLAVGAFGVFGRNQVGKLLLVCIHTLLLGFLEHLHARIVEAIVVHDIKPDACVQSSLFDLLCETEFDEGSLEAIMPNLLALFFLLSDALLLEHSMQHLLVFNQEETVDGLDFFDGDFKAHLAPQPLPVLELGGKARIASNVIADLLEEVFQVFPRHLRQELVALCL